ncbi:hypothetical protein ACQEVG_16460 [Streptomyces sp. CA-135486]|uniref:hypothetical protein n=1 Tax=Streptomyces sp. CA-135486 TaxID=3240049 RepID=UPI003D93BFE8
MSEQWENTNLKDQYGTQLAADLERNEKEQEHLKTQLTALQRDHALLLSLQQALESGASPVGSGERVTADVHSTGAESGTAVNQAAVPRARKGKGETHAGSGRPKKAAAPAKTAAKAKYSGKPTLRDLVAGHLAEQHEPRSVAEVTAELTTAHPDRTLSATVVRNTLENLVAKAEVERTKQGGSVYYTAVRPQPSAEAIAEPVAVEA